MIAENSNSRCPRVLNRARFYRLLLFCSMAALVLALMPAAGHAQAGKGHPVCGRVGQSIQVSSGGQMWCFGSQPNGASAKQATAIIAGIANVNAANTSEDITPSGVRISGQSETSIAASGSNVLEAWNDATGFFVNCPGPSDKDELTGLGFSNNSGATFTDLGGAPNSSNCANYKLFGDPSVGVYTPVGATYFYIASLYLSVSSAPLEAIALTPCQVLGSGSGATLSCQQPVVAAISSDCISFFGFEFCSFLDKEFLTIDNVGGRVYITYTEFGVSSNFAGEIQLAACDLEPNPLAPVCSNGSNFAGGFGAASPAYLTIQPGDNVNNCEFEGSYPAFSHATGDLYAAWESNWFTNFLGGSSCLSQPTEEQVARVRASCLTDPALGPSTCAGPSNTNNVSIVSIDAAFIPGYNRFPPNDFPRIAVSDPHKTVSIVWNDTRNVPLGQIFMESFSQGSLAAVQATPTILNTGSIPALHFLPALRNSSSSGLLNVSWFDRRLNPSSAKTDTFAALNVSPLATSVASNTRITNFSSDWNAVSSDVVPNFGDYTDNYVSATNTLFIAWTDGRLQDPQPFEAHTGVH